MVKKFNPLVVSSHFFTCGLPLNLDSYRYCPFNCKYCFMKNRVVGKGDYEKVPNLHWLGYKFKKVYDKKDINPTDFIEVLLKNRIDLHCGTKSEPFQPIEEKKCFTKEIIELCNHYGQNIVFTTKSDDYYDVPLNPEHHSFQFSITNHYDDRILEPNTPPLESRLQFYHKLKDEGFKVGVRIQPFIPMISQVDKIVELFPDVDYVHIENLMLSPQKNNDMLLDYIGWNKKDCTSDGRLTLKNELWYQYLKPYFQFLDDGGYSWNSGFMNIGNNNCCCGDALVHKCTDWSTLHLKHKYGESYTVDDGLESIGEYCNCKCNMLYTSNRRGDNVTVEDFYKDRWDTPRCRFNPKNKFKPPSDLDYYFKYN